MTLRTALRLGRVSNLPTVWTNVGAGLALGGWDPPAAPELWAVLALAMSLTYVGGMWLNDAFDARWDTEHRAERPIPQGEATVGAVFAGGFAMLVAGGAIVAALARPAALVATAALCGLIVCYDAFHKRNPLAPFLMAACRAALYAVGATAAAPGTPAAELLTRPAFLAATLALFAWVAGLTLVARRESTRPAFRRAVPVLIAAISFLDAAVFALCGIPQLAPISAAAFLLTRRWQRHVPGT